MGLAGQLRLIAECRARAYSALYILLLLYTPTRGAVDNTQIQLMCYFKREREKEFRE